MPKIPRISPFLKQCFVTAALGSNIIGHGCAIGYPAVLLPQLAGPGAPLALGAAAASWIASVLGVTQLAGSFLTPPAMARRGRRAAHLALTAPALLGWLAVAVASDVEMLFFGRVLHGLSIGMMAPLRSVLIGEYCSPKSRGAFLTTVSLTQAFGIFFVHLVGSFLSWQRTALVCLFFPFASLVMTMYSPESPSWLLSRGRYDECREVFRWLRGDDEEDELEHMIEARILFENARLYRKNTQKPNRVKNMLETMQQKEFYKPIIIMIHAYAMVQFCGSTTMAAYSTTIIGLVMGPTVNAHFWMIFLDTQRLITNSIAVFVVNKLKRRTVMFATGGLCVLSQAALAGYTYARAHGAAPRDAVWLPALLINLQFFTVATGMLPLPNVIGGEVFPLQYKSIGGTVSLATMSVSFFVVLKTFPGLVESVGIWGAYAVYGGLLAYCLAVMWALLPETRGRTLQQIEDGFRGRARSPAEASEAACPERAYRASLTRHHSLPLLH